MNSVVSWLVLVVLIGAVAALVVLLRRVGTLHEEVKELEVDSETLQVLTADKRKIETELDLWRGEAARLQDENTRLQNENAEHKAYFEQLPALIATERHQLFVQDVLSVEDVVSRLSPNLPVVGARLYNRLMLRNEDSRFAERNRAVRDALIEFLLLIDMARRLGGGDKQLIFLNLFVERNVPLLLLVNQYATQAAGSLEEIRLTDADFLTIAEGVFPHAERLYQLQKRAIGAPAPALQLGVSQAGEPTDPQGTLPGKRGGRVVPVIPGPDFPASGGSMADRTANQAVPTVRSGGGSHRADDPDTADGEPLVDDGLPTPNTGFMGATADESGWPNDRTQDGSLQVAAEAVPGQQPFSWTTPQDAGS